MDEISAEIESELLDLSTENVETLSSVDFSDIAPTIARVRERIADSETSVSGYSGSSSRWAGEPDAGAEDRIA
jgi:hypothetical protein